MKFPFRLWLDGGVIFAILALGTWLYFHIEKLGEQKVQREVAAALNEQRNTDAKEIANAKQTLTELQTRFDTTVHTVPRPDRAPVVRVCDNPVRSGASSKDAGPGPSADAAVRPGRGMDQGPGPEHDVTNVTLRVLADAGARINYLQGYIKACQEQGFCDADTPR